MGKNNRPGLDMLVLQVLTRGDLHGYAISKSLQQGPLYPALQRLELNGWIEGEWRLAENNRRVRLYRLTRDGLLALTGPADASPVASWEARALCLAIWLWAHLSLAAAQAPAGSEAPGDDRIRSAIRQAEQLRHTGALEAAYRVLYTARDGRSGRTEAALMNSLGSVLQDLGRLDEAEQHYRQALRMLENQFGPDDPDLVFALNNLGSLMMARGRLTEAARLRERSLELRARTYPPADPAVLRAVENLAAVRLAQKQYAEAERLFEQSRKAWEDRQPNSPEAAIALNGLGAVALRTKRKEQAAALFREAIDRWPPDTEPLLLAQVLANMARVVAPGEGLPLYTRAVALVEKHGGPEHPLLAALYDRQAACLRRLHRTRESHEWAARARQIRQANPTGLAVDASALE
ncbi:MAG: tetratricopeptide repeat protein [Bryobacteraceae bacterium]|jgi:tetratricopeptide (TPR) repeat protein